jgi:hypothetical protein
VTAPTEELRTAPLAEVSAPAAFLLSAEAGWNQTLDDWRLMLVEGEAIGQFSAAGQLVASALILPYDEQFAWIGMVLTTERQRRRGLATSNLRWAIERCAARSLIAGLDATPAGREVYAPLGFADLWGLQRLSAARPILPEPAQQAVIRPMQDGDLAAVAAMDGEAFGAKRAALIAHLHQRQPALAWVAQRKRGGLAGLVLGRDGRAMPHLGPLVAEDPDVATTLAARALSAMDGPVSIDVPDRQTQFRARLTLAGFAPVRPFTRMLRCSGAGVGRAGFGFAIAGPELG